MHQISRVSKTNIRRSNTNNKSIKSRSHSSNNNYGNISSDYNQSFVSINKGVTCQNQQIFKKFIATKNIQQIGFNKRIFSKLTMKSVQQLHQQNLYLKKQLNKIKEQLQQLRGKFQVKSKRCQERGKQLDLQFQKQIYWGGSKSHLISGIKHQYNKLKKQYQQNRKQNNALKIAFINTKIAETSIYIQSLQTQNKRLVEKLFKIDQKSLKLSPESSKKSQSIIYQQEQKIKKLQQSLLKIENKNKFLIQDDSRKSQKINFLQKFLIQKDNQIYHLGRKIRKLQRTLQKNKQTNQMHRQEIFQIQNNYKRRINQISKKFQQQKNIVKSQFNLQINQLKSKISYLLQNNSQLQNTVNKLKSNNIALINTSKRKASVSANGNFMSNIPKVQLASSHIYCQNNINKSMIWSRNSQIPEGSNIKSEESEKQVNFAADLNKTGDKIMQRADRKHSQHSRKMRKVKFSEVMQIGEFLRYKMMAKSIKQQQIKNIFNNKNKSEVNGELNQQLKQNWQQQYITMKQTINILIQQPFNLQEQPAYLLSRYLVEDYDEQYVYCDLGNQNKRQIVRSILKSLIGNYHISSQKNQKQIQQFKQVYLNNFYTALKTYYPNGKVSKKKFTQLLLSMGSQLSQQSQQLFTAKVVDKSLNLSQLQYEFLSNL